MGKNPTDRGKKGTKESVLVDAEGGPLGAVLGAANVNDHLLLQETIEAIVIERPEPTPEAPQHLSLDADYDNPTGREAAAAGKYTPHIVPKEKAKRSKARAKGHKPRRWVVERTFAWITRSRRTVRDYERLPAHHETIVYWSMIIIMSRRLARHNQSHQLHPT